MCCLIPYPCAMFPCQSPSNCEKCPIPQRYGRGFDQNTHFNHLQSPFWWITVPFVIRDFVGTKSCPGYPCLRNPLLSFFQDGLTLHLWWLKPKILTIQLIVEWSQKNDQMRIYCIYCTKKTNQLNINKHVPYSIVWSKEV